MHTTTVQTLGSYTVHVGVLVGWQTAHQHLCVHDVWEPVEGGNMLWDMIHVNSVNKTCNGKLHNKQ